jgi:hypothetical protein
VALHHASITIRGIPGGGESKLPAAYALGKRLTPTCSFARLAPMRNADNDLLYKVAYDEAVRALSEQQVVIDSFRTRAGLLLSAAAITTSFLGAQALNGGDSNLATWLAMTGFAGVAAISLAILWPRQWEFTANPRDVIQTYIEADEPAPIEELHRDLSLHMHNSYLENRKGLEQLAVFFQVASGMLTLEVILWIIAIASTA